MLPISSEFALSTVPTRADAEIVVLSCLNAWYESLSGEITVTVNSAAFSVIATPRLADPPPAPMPRLPLRYMFMIANMVATATVLSASPLRPLEAL